MLRKATDCDGVVGVKCFPTGGVFEGQPSSAEHGRSSGRADLFFVYGRGGITFEEGSSRDGFGGLLRSTADQRDSDQLLVKSRCRF